MKRITLAILIIASTCISSHATEINKPFGEWLVSCKQNLITAKNECFIGTPF